MTYYNPKFSLGQKVKFYDNLILNNEVKSQTITVYGEVSKILVCKDIIQERTFYMYELDSGDVVNEINLMSREG